MIGEDSAYRQMSRRSRAARDLLAIHVKIQSKLNGINVSGDVDQALASSDRDLLLEDSAIRAIYKSDQAFFEILGIWCHALDKRFGGLAQDYRTEARRVRLQAAGDDSAIRASYYYLSDSMTALKAILTASGDELAARTVIARAGLATLGDDSAWRAAMNHAEGVAALMLLMLEKRNAAAAKTLRERHAAIIRGDESALRIHAAHKQALVDTLSELVKLP